MKDTAQLVRKRYEALEPVLGEQGRRRFAAAEARVLGWGGVSLVSQVTGMARSTINRGVVEIEQNRSADAGRVRRPGGGRKPKAEQDPALLDDLKSLLEAATRLGEAKPTAVRFSIGQTLVDLDAGAFEAADGRDHGSI